MRNAEAERGKFCKRNKFKPRSIIWSGARYYQAKFVLPLWLQPNTDKSATVPIQKIRWQTKTLVLLLSMLIDVDLNDVLKNAKRYDFEFGTIWTETETSIVKVMSCCTNGFAMSPS
jgi:hypothetical protein